MRNSKLIFSAAVAISAIAGMCAAAAADLGVRPYTKAAPMVVDPAYNWSGFYVGANVGYAWGHENRTQTSSNGAGNTCPAFGPAGCDIVDTDLTGAIGGFQVGANYQTGAWVFGVEGDIAATGMTGCGQFVFSPAGWGACEKVRWLSTQTGRIGYAGFGDGRLLAFVKGGVAEVGTERYATSPGNIQVTATQTETRVGWTVGGGLEWAILNNWSAKVEYDYADFGKQNYLAVGIGALTGLLENFSVSEHFHQVKFGLNYRFGMPAAVVARY